MTPELSEQEIVRRKSLEELTNMGVNAYPADLFEINVSAKEILEKYTAENQSYTNVSNECA